MFPISLSSSNHDRDKLSSVAVSAAVPTTPKSGTTTAGWLGALGPIIRTAIAMEMDSDDDDDCYKEDDDENDSMGQSPLRPHRQQQLLLRQQFPVAAAAAAAAIAATTTAPYNHNHHHHTNMPSTTIGNGNGHGTDSAAAAASGAYINNNNSNHNKNSSSHHSSPPPRHKRLGSSESASSTSSTVSTATSSVTTSTPWLLPTSSTHNTSATTTNNNNNNCTPLTKEEAEQYKLKTQQKIVVGSIGAVLNFLKCNSGVSTASLEQLEKNVQLGRYFAVLCRAQEYLQLLQPPTRAEAEAQMFLSSSAWEALCQWKAIQYRRAYNYAFRLRFETDEEGNPRLKIGMMGMGGGTNTDSNTTTTATTITTTTSTVALSRHSHHHNHNRQDLQQQQQQQHQQYYDNNGDICYDYADEDHWDGHGDYSDDAEEYPDETDLSPPPPPPLLSRQQTQQQRQHELDIRAAVERQVQLAEQCTSCQKRLFLVRVWQQRLQHHLQWKERQEKRQERQQKQQQQLQQLKEHVQAAPIK